MAERLIAVLDIGKTLSKLSLWTPAGTQIDRQVHTNQAATGNGYRALDVSGVEQWMRATLASFAKQGDVEAIIPVAHGGGAAIVRAGRLAAAPIDYETPIPAEVMAAYRKGRDPFAHTGSPALRDGLNLGAQLHLLETLDPGLLTGDAAILTFAQYWAWLLCGEMATEVTSLGCHTDLWRPLEMRPSDMVVSRGWADRLAPLRAAGDVLGTIRAELADATGLSRNVRVHCGLHDSNAALLAARAFGPIGQSDATVLSTGTWFVAMRTPLTDEPGAIARLPEARDCLVNVDVAGRAIPSARFMGGREIQDLTGVDSRRIDIRPDQPAILAACGDIVSSRTMILPTMAPGSGPFGDRRGGWINEATDSIKRRAAVSLYAAMVADAALDLIGTRETILIEGRFAEAELFVRAVATLRPDQAIYVSNAHNDVSFGALRLLDPDIAPSSELIRVAPLEADLSAYRGEWEAAIPMVDRAA